MRMIFGFLTTLLSIYSVLIIIRIILTWFSHTQYSKPVQVLSRITDPYLDWWRNSINLRAGVLDLSPIVAMAALSVLQTICSTIASRGKMSMGILFIVLLSAIWSVLSFIIGFCILVLVLRLIAFMGNNNMYSGFWRIIDTISKPLMYRINRIIFGKRLVKFTTGLIVSIAVLAAAWVLGRFAVKTLTDLLVRMSV